MKSSSPLLLALLLAACGPGTVNPPDEPARPVQSPDALQEIQPPGPSSLANRGAKSFVGRWAASAAWCVDPQGDKRPIDITPMRFEGYENRCDIERIAEVASGYELSLVCAAEGRTRRERVLAAVSGDMLSLVYLDRAGDAATRLGSCPGSPKPEAQTSGLMKMLKKGG
ncbi:hypothetical protein [uncultured Brevundimonas sp.]|uniref:hypothetical protein n=1 Tax=uncultured Brevundimonas sp. TaxID=213418 RepID=UPI00259362AC|nr:hypothetical protein [uncultured Brevundimonas sp.]